MSLYFISLTVLLGSLLIMIVLSLVDYKRKSGLKELPFISIIVPCHNSRNNIKETIESIYTSYNRGKFELFVIDDKSSDDTLDLLLQLNKKYDFKIIQNKKNIGKAKSINLVVEKTKSEFVFVVDSDVIVNNISILDILSRITYDNKIAAVSCPCVPKSKDFFSTMQHIEYNMIFLINSSYNVFSCLYLCGAFHCFRKSAFIKVGKFSENAIVEDIDLAFKLNEKGFIVKHAHNAVMTQVPLKFKEWYKQKLRWSSGVMQCYIRHIKTWIKHPLHIFLILSYSFIIALSVYSLISEMVFWDKAYDNFSFLYETTGLILAFEWMGFVYGTQILLNVVSKLSFSLFSFPYVITLVGGLKEWYKLFLCFPYSLIYFPVLMICSVHGFIIAIIKYRKLQKSTRAW